ncbi:arginine--tRNA ligase [Hydrogenibacillus sp. N12]|uniref:arginine--tRNA ligase n=1 Tax=Hydrogenibacillus sp. N12 TaxID=2866627 RepID=UPI001C7D555F|nr:arginine--tRNA ligase [Hydrogenibacillus sp. N12]QZA33925.1 arginine--tRNA ligase [Hydrogenibacillus sp. N12]
MLKRYAAERLSSVIPDLSVEAIEAALEVPPNPAFGDWAFPAFPLAKTRRKAPPIIAREIAEALTAGVSGLRAEAVGGFVNLRLDRATVLPDLLRALSAPEHKAPKVGAGERVIIDMSSPNIAKPFGVGHLRSTVIGRALANLYARLGYTPVRVNHIGDWGTQFGKQIAAYKRWGEAIDRDGGAEAGKDRIRFYLSLYVRFHEEAERDPSLEAEGRRWFQKLEAGDPEARRLWQMFVEDSLREFERMYRRLGVEFDRVIGESFYNDRMPAVIDELREKGLLEESEGAMVVRLEDEGLPPCLILKSDGTTLYATRDLATAIYRHDEMGGDWLVYVVGQEQTLHFKQVFSVLKKMGRTWADRCVHVPFGLLRFAGKKLSTRKGHVIFLEDVIDEAVAKAREIIEEKNPALENKDEVAEAVGIGAIVFGDLKNGRLGDVNFSLEEALNFDGETGPYVQYTHARARTVLARAAEDADPAALAAAKARLESGGPLPPSATAALATDAAWAVLGVLDRYPAELRAALERYEPSVVARYALELAKAFNRFYHAERILVPDVDERAAKLVLVERAADVLQDALGLLGIAAPERI